MVYPKCSECGFKFKDKVFLETHMDKEHAGWREPKPINSKGWCTPYGFVDFAEKVTYEHACKVAKNIHEKFAHKDTEGGQTQDIDSIGKSGVQTL